MSILAFSGAHLQEIFVTCTCYPFRLLIRANWHSRYCLQEAGIPVKLAPTIGIAVDHRRRNKCVESLLVNAARLKVYKAKLIVFPRRSKKTKVRDMHAA